MKSSTVIFLPILLAISSLPLGAQEDPVSLYDLSLADLLNVRISTVTSGFQESNLDAASSIEVVDVEDWRLTGSRNYWDAIGHLPGMLVTTSVVSSEALVYRGISISPGTNGTAMIIDDVPVNSLLHSTGFFHLNNIGLNTLSKIEMIQGPGSALYGADAFQGVLSLHTKRGEGPLNEIESSIGHEDFRNLSASVAEHLTDNLTAGLSYDYKESQPEKVIFFDGSGGKFSPNRDTRYALQMPKEAKTLSSFVTFSPSDDFRLNASFLYNGTEELVNRFHSNRPLHNLLIGEFYLGQANLEYQLASELQLEGQVYYWRGDITWDFFQHDPITKQAFNTASRFNARDHRYGADLRIKREDQDSRFHWQLGVSLSSAEADDFTKGLVASDRIKQGSIGYTRDLASLYGEVRIPVLSDALDIVSGARLDGYSDFGGQFSPKFGLVYYLSESSRTKFLYGHAFRAPSASEIAVEPLPGQAGAFGDPDLEPETIDTYELIYMKNWREQYIEAILFYNEIEDGILQDGLPLSDPRANPDPAVNARQTVRTNGANSKSHGVVLKHGVELGDWRIDSNLTFAKGRNTTADYDYDSYPSWIGNTAISYDWSEDFKVSLINRVAYGRSTFQTRNDNDAPTDAKDYYRTDLNLTNKFSDRWATTLNVRNLFNNEDLHKASFHGETWKLDQGASAWLSVRYSF